MADKNVVISGKYEGYSVKKTDSGRAYISGTYMDFSKDNVASYQQVDQRSGNALTGAVLAGEVGAIVASNTKTYLVEVTWKSGGVSLIKVTPEIFEAIVATTYKSKADSEGYKKHEEADFNFKAKMYIIMGIAYIIFYFIGNA